MAVEEIREGTVRTEVIEDRDKLCGRLLQWRFAAGSVGCERPCVDRTPEPVAPSDPAPEAIVVLSNADDKVISTSGADDRFEVIPRVFVDLNDESICVGKQETQEEIIIWRDVRW